MANKNKRRRRRQQAARAVEVGKIKAVSATGEGRADKMALEKVAEQVKGDIERDKTRLAVEKAKQIHKQVGTAESEALLVDAYYVRVKRMAESEMSREAQSLMEVVIRKYPSAAGRFQDMRFSLGVQTGRLDDMAAALNDPELPAEKRAEIERLLKYDLADLSMLADCEALPGDHPLRREAAELQQAFQAVTSGPVDDEQIRLAGIPRRSPLADWKTLIRAIACFYRQEDEACEKRLGALDRGSAAARVAPALIAMMNPGGKEERGKAALETEAVRLIEAVSGEHFALRETLQQLDRAAIQNPHQQSLDPRAHRHVLQLINQAVKLCQKVHPELVERLKQHIAVCCSMAEIPSMHVMEAMGGPSRKEAYFWRLFARAMELCHVTCQACYSWDLFRRQALNEGWFERGGPEERAVYQHMIELLKPVPADELIEIRKDFEYDIYHIDELNNGGPIVTAHDEKTAEEGTPCYYLYPDKLYERMAACGADSEMYRQWLNHACKTDAKGSRANDIAERWHNEFPDDPEPLLHLMFAAEKRNALRKALKYLEKAEQLDSLSPEVKRARLRLWVATAMRHLKQRKGHLIEKDLEQMVQLPQAQEGDRPAFLAGLKWAVAQLQENQVDSERFYRETCDLIGSDLAGLELVAYLAETGGIRNKLPSADKKALKRHAELLQAAGRLCRLGNEINVPFGIPDHWESYLIKALKRKDCRLDMTLLHSLAESALRDYQADLAFAVTRLGLQTAGTGRGWFLLLRAQLYSKRGHPRAQECLAATATLAQRQGDMTLRAKAVDIFQEKRFQWGGIVFGLQMVIPEELHLDDEELSRILEQETKAKKMPRISLRDYRSGDYLDDEFDSDSECQCPACRRRRGETGREKGGKRPAEMPDSFLFDDMFEEDDELDEDFAFEDEDDFDDDAGYEDDEEAAVDFGKFPLEFMDVLLDIFIKNGGQEPDRKDLDRIAREEPELMRRLEEVLKKMERKGIVPPGGLNDGPVSPPKENKSKRKDRRQGGNKMRKNRRR